MYFNFMNSDVDRGGGVPDAPETPNMITFSLPFLIKECAAMNQGENYFSILVV